MIPINQVYFGDCLDWMPLIDDKAIDLIILDPPYNIKKAKWDKIPNYVSWMGKIFAECERVLKDNGSFYFFHNDFLQVVELQNWLNKNSKFIFKQLIIWNKRFNEAKNKGYLDGFIEVNGLRNYQKMAEYILFYTFQDETGLTKIYADRSNFKIIRAYMNSELNKTGLTKKEINILLNSSTSGGGMACHIFGNTDQWSLPTKDNYNKLQTTGFFKKSYEALRQEYEALRQEYESLRYTFNNQKTHHSVWNYEIEEKQGHETQKPISLIKNIILHSSNENDLILDPMCGSGTIIEACLNTNRNFIAIEKEEKYYNICLERYEKCKTATTST